MHWSITMKYNQTWAVKEMLMILAMDYWVPIMCFSKAYHSQNQSFVNIVQCKLIFLLIYVLLQSHLMNVFLLTPNNYLVTRYYSDMTISFI